ncbi:MAG: C39 family peptidase [Gammaproteobacteria bacterium AqS3]|nr:C39 family peptidase [Gammaproteobacteria bacterium AqS3]
MELQNLDYSCGSAALATLLREFYGIPTDEAEILERIDRESAASFADLSRVAGSFGFRAVGYRMSLSSVLKLRIPVLIYVKYRQNDHFSVIRGVRPDGLIALADPSWGNRRLLPHQFMELWDTEGSGKGLVLVVVPKDKNHPVRPDFFEAPSAPTAAYDALHFVSQRRVL